jgi:predicted DNA-binding transcriptional regulator AlpA
MQRNARNRSREDLLKTRDVCQIGQVCPRTVDYWREKNLLPYVKLGGAVRFLRSDVEQFIRSHRVG